MSPSAECKRRWLYQPTHSTIANSSWVRVRQTRSAITIACGRPVVPLPEGDRYLGFLFARGLTAEAVERALRDAHAQLRIRIEPRARPARATAAVR